MFAVSMRSQTEADAKGNPRPIPRPSGNCIAVADVPCEESGCLHEMHPVRLVAHVVEHAGPAEQDVLYGMAVVGHQWMRACMRSSHQYCLKQQERWRFIWTPVAVKEFGHGDDREERVNVFKVCQHQRIAYILRRERRDLGREILRRRNPPDVTVRLPRLGLADRRIRIVQRLGDGPRVADGAAPGSRIVQRSLLRRRGRQRPVDAPGAGVRLAERPVEIDQVDQVGHGGADVGNAEALRRVEDGPRGGADAVAEEPREAVARKLLLSARPGRLLFCMLHLGSYQRCRCRPCERR